MSDFDETPRLKPYMRPLSQEEKAEAIARIIARAAEIAESDAIKAEKAKIREENKAKRREEVVAAAQVRYFQSPKAKARQEKYNAERREATRLKREARNSKSATDISKKRDPSIPTAKELVAEAIRAELATRRTEPQDE